METMCGGNEVILTPGKPLGAPTAPMNLPLFPPGKLLGRHGTQDSPLSCPPREVLGVPQHPGPSLCPPGKLLGSHAPRTLPLSPREALGAPTAPRTFPLSLTSAQQGTAWAVGDLRWGPCSLQTR